MIFYGTKAVHVISANLPTTKCSECNTTGQINMSIFSRHAHVYWIPLFPAGKVAIAQCEHCKKAYKTDEMSQKMLSYVHEIKKEAKTPLWQFTGIGIIAGFVLIAKFVWEPISNKANTLIINNPAVGDVYSVKTESGYTTLKLAEVTADSVWYYQNQYGVDKILGIDEIKIEKNYIELPVGISRKEQKANFAKGTYFSP
jgi:hypothetical protein